MTQDAQGHRLSGATAGAVTLYDQAVRAFNLVHGDAVGLFDKVCQAAPEFAMAYLGKAWVFALANDPGLMTQTAALVETARPLTLNEREAGPPRRPLPSGAGRPRRCRWRAGPPL